MKNYFATAILRVSLLLGLMGCQVTDDPVLESYSFNEKKSFSTSEDEEEKGIVLGALHQDPYTLENMEKALASLHSQKILNAVSSHDLEADYLYIKFLPQNEAEFAALKDSYNLELSAIPHCAEILESGTYYHDPSLPEDQLTWQYTLLPVDAKIPLIQHQLIDHLFLGPLMNKESKVTKDDYLILEKASFKLTGNEWEEQEESNKTTANWTPNGVIQAEDDELGVIPLVGAKVKARRWHLTGIGITDDNGYFYSDRAFNSGRQVHYSIVWERKHNFDIRSGSHGQAIYNGPRSDQSWNLTIDAGVQKFYAAIHRAAHHYYFDYIHGLRRPNHRMKIGGYDRCQDFGGDFANWRTWLTWPDIRVYRKKGSDCSIKDTREIFATTSHEVAHGSHWQMAKDNGDRNDFFFGADKLVESWARLVEWLLTNEYYQGHGSSLNWRGGYQYYTFNDEYFLYLMQKGYTPLGIDLIDEYNQRMRIGTFNLSCSQGFSRFTSRGRACWIGDAPAGSTAFVYPYSDGTFYHTPLPGNYCPGAATFDGANCRFHNIPSAGFGFVENNSYFLQPEGNKGYPNDHVTGYTPRQLEDALVGKRLLSEWRDQLFSSYNNPSEIYLNELFGYYINL